MQGRGVCIVSYEAVTAFGHGVRTCFDGLLSGRTAIGKVRRFDTGSFRSDYAGVFDGLSYHGDESLVMQMLRVLLAGCPAPPDARLYLATTKGEIDVLEKALLEGLGDIGSSNPLGLLSSVKNLMGLKGRGILVSAACVSSTAALARAAADIRARETDCALVVGCDSVTEFIYSGFSSLMALSGGIAMPFDRDRDGLSVGDGAAYALLMSRERAEKEGLPRLGEIAGWGMSSDANHMTGPSRDGGGQALSILRALRTAGIAPEDICCISAHGTGTVYNDSMEMKAFRKVFGESRKHVYSVKAQCACRRDAAADGEFKQCGSGGGRLGFRCSCIYGRGTLRPFHQLRFRGG
jgi:3-oxoacyl-[acyl-carrier-protein] synthase II